MSSTMPKTKAVKTVSLITESSGTKFDLPENSWR